MAERARARRRAGATEAGSGTMLMIIVIAALLILLPVALGVVTAVQANARARAAADLGSIAAAGSYVEGHTPEVACATGYRIVTDNEAVPLGCRISSDGQVRMSTRVFVQLPVIGRRATESVARAGPVLPPGL